MSQVNVTNTLIEEFSLKKWQVTNTIKLIDEGNTIPFIARYRKEVTGELSDEILRKFYEKLCVLRNIEEKKADIIRLIDEQGLLTDELKNKIENAKTITELDDIYLPFRPKRRTRATIAKEKGLLPLAEIIMECDKNIDIKKEAENFIDEEKGVLTTDDAIFGAMDIIAEIISDDADLRKTIRQKTYQMGVVSTKASNDEDSVYNMYYDFSEPASKIANHRILAINRGEKEKYLTVKIDVDEEELIGVIKNKIITKKAPSVKYIESACEDSYKRLIEPSIEREIRSDLTEIGEESAIDNFGKNLESLLLTPPMKEQVVLAFDPGYVNGCKIAVVDPTGKYLDSTVIKPFLNGDTENRIKLSKEVVVQLIKRHNVDIIAIGNGTASRESEKFCSEMIKEYNLTYNRLRDEIIDIITEKLTKKEDDKW